MILFQLNQLNSIDSRQSIDIQLFINIHVRDSLDSFEFLQKGGSHSHSLEIFDKLYITCDAHLFIVKKLQFTD